MAKTTSGVPEHLWRVPAFLEYVQPPLTDEAVTAAEAQLGVALPATYLACLRAQNGGYLRRPWGVCRVIQGIGPKFPSINRDKAWWRPKNAKPGAWMPKGAELLIPFDGEGHWDLCFDYRESGPTGEPQITLVYQESESEEPVAASFEAYLQMLPQESEYPIDFRIRRDVTAESVARAIARALDRGEPTVSAFAHGYPAWQVMIKAGDPRGTGPYHERQPEWCSCWHNRVPTGFWREGNEVHTTAETALLEPEDPESVVLVICSPGSRAAVETILRDLSLVP